MINSKSIGGSAKRHALLFLDMLCQSKEGKLATCRVPDRPPPRDSARLNNMRHGYGGGLGGEIDELEGDGMCAIFW